MSGVSFNFIPYQMLRYWGWGWGVQYIPFIHSWDSGSRQLLNACDFNILVFLGFTYICHIAFLYFQLYIIFTISYKSLLLIIIITVIVIMVIINIFIISIIIVFITTNVNSSVIILLFISWSKIWPKDQQLFTNNYSLEWSQQNVQFKDIPYMKLL